MDLFWNTAQITLGILLPPAAIVLIIIVGYIIIGAIEYLNTIKLHETEELKKKPPYDEVETSFDAFSKKAIVKFYKDGEMVWAGDVIEGLKK